MKETLIQVMADHFTAGIVAKDGVVCRAAPILAWMLGMTGKEFVEYCRRKGWRWEVVK